MRIHRSKETGASYSLPEGYEVNDSPPMPVNESLNQLNIEESWDRFESQLGLDASAAVGSGSFSVSATASSNKSLRSEEEAYYAVRSSFVPLWKVYIPDQRQCLAELADPDIPAPFDPKHRHIYDAFFQSHGSHYVRGAWVGGKSMLVFTVTKSTNLNKEDIQAGIKASFGSASGSVQGKQAKSREKLLSSSQCTVIGKGGNEVQLAAMSSLDQEAYNTWLSTIPQNPQVIELDVAGIWNLVGDRAKSEALQAAYKEAVSFEPIRAVFDLESHLYFIRGGNFISYDRKTKQTSTERSLAESFPELDRMGFEVIDDSFRG
ncbi:MAG: MAC/perforin domain-containing protein, partial [Nannocystaceae bacterium]